MPPFCLAVLALAGRLTMDALLDIKHPSQAAWSPDGGRIAFVWDRAGTQNVYVVGSRQGDQYHTVTTAGSYLSASDKRLLVGLAPTSGCSSSRSNGPAAPSRGSKT